MKIVLLLANGNYAILPSVRNIITSVLAELDVKVDVIDLSKVGYFLDGKNEEMNQIVKSITESKAVIALSHVPFVGMHASMQNFLDHMGSYDEIAQGKPLLAITYSEWMGEIDAAHMIAKGWSILGGGMGGTMCLNSHMTLEEITKPLERHIENLYRLMKQEKNAVICNERYAYIHSSKNTNMPKEREIKSFVELLTREEKREEIAPNQESFVAMGAGVYARPGQATSHLNRGKKLQSLPHYFVAKHDKTIDMIVQYILTNTGEKGYLIIKNGDCEYYEGITDNPTIEVSLTDEMLQTLMTKKMTYQKAFMVGKLKVRGNFVLVARLDQIFKAI